MLSSLCPVYNAAAQLWLLEEAVESFLRQDYTGSRELIILNDTPGQELTCSAPSVYVVNTSRRFRTLGEKRNALVAMSSGYILLPWDWDDISLPNRLSQANVALDCHDYFKPCKNLFLYNGVVARADSGYGHNCSAYTRSAHVGVGGYPCTNYDDAEMDDLLRSEVHTLYGGDYSYIYRWGVSNCHFSGHRDLDQHYAIVGKQTVRSGTFDIRPHWKQDYAALSRAAIEGGLV